MATVRIKTTPDPKGKPDRYLEKDIKILSRKRLRALRVITILLFLSLCFNVYNLIKY